MKWNENQSDSKGKGQTKVIKRKRSDKISRSDMRHIRMKDQRKQINTFWRMCVWNNESMNGEEGD
jgi:hypothetical protein